MSDLVAFLLARIADDEALAAGALGQHWSANGYREVRTGSEDDPRYYKVVGVGAVREHWDSPEILSESAGTYRHIANWDPSRVLAECQAKRQVVELAANALEHDIFKDSMERLLSYEIALRMVQVYRDHPDCQPGWRLSDD